MTAPATPTKGHPLNPFEPQRRTIRGRSRTHGDANTAPIHGHLLRRRRTPATTDEVAGVMARLQAGDPEATLDLFEIAWSPVRWIMESTLRDAGFSVDRELIDDATLDGLVLLADHAGGWRPERGAKPWNWARLRLRRVAFEVLGHVADELPEEDGGSSDEDRPGRRTRDAGLLTAPSVEDLLVDGRELSTFERLRRGAGLPDGIDATLAAAIVDGLRAIARERHAEAWLEVHLEKANGNTEAAVTVSTQLGLTAANVRQIDRRVTQRLADRHGMSPYDTDLATLFTPSA